MDDLISRQDAIDAIRKSTEAFTGFMEMEMYTDDDAVEAIINLPSAQQWIPCSERLPEPNEKDEKGFTKAYLVQNARWMDVARWNGGFWVAWGYGTVVKDVTAWMPLPKPYQGGKS